MTRRGLHLVLALGLIMSLFAGTLVVGSAEDHDDIGPNAIYFPWVPNGVVIEDPREEFGNTGPYFGSIAVQNLEAVDIDVTWILTETGDSDSFTMGPLESVTINAVELFDGVSNVEGSGVVVTAVIADEEAAAPTSEHELNGENDHELARIAGVQKQASPIAPDGDARTGAAHQIVGGYTGLTETGIGEHVVLPIAQTNTNWNTLIRVTNFDPEDSTDITVSFRPQGGSGWEANFTAEDVESGETATFDLLDLAPPGEWVGSAFITADTDVGAVAERVKNETNMLIMNVSRVVPEQSDEHYAPLVFQEWFQWNTGISVANLTNQENEVTIRYFDINGTEISSQELTIPPYGMDFDYTPAPPNGNDNGDGFVGSAIIEADGPIYGAVDEVKYFGTDLDTGHAMSYMIEQDAAGLGESLVMPLVQKGVVQDNVSIGDTSGIHLFNPTADFVVVGVSYLDEDGEEALTELHLLEGFEGLTSYTVELNLPDNFQGSAVIQVLAGDGAVVAASNIVNYAVEYDGSSSYNLVLTGDVGPEIPVEEVEQVTES